MSIGLYFSGFRWPLRFIFSQIESDCNATLFETCNSYYRCCLWRRVSTPNALMVFQPHQIPLEMCQSQRAGRYDIVMDSPSLAEPKMIPNLRNMCKKSSIMRDLVCGFSLLDQGPQYDNTGGMPLNFISSDFKQLF